MLTYLLLFLHNRFPEVEIIRSKVRNSCQKKPACNHEELVDKLTLKDILLNNCQSFFKNVSATKDKCRGTGTAYKRLNRQQLKAMRDTEVNHG